MVNDGAYAPCRRQGVRYVADACVAVLPTILQEPALRVHSFTVGPMDNNTYVVEDEATGAAAVIDPAFGSERVLAFIQSRGLRLEWVLNTHAHLDHVVLNGAFVEATGATLAIHPNELPMLRATREQAS